MRVKLKRGDTVQVSQDGVVWQNAVYDKKALKNIHWVVMPDGSRESFAEPLVKPTQETITKYTKFPGPPKHGFPEGPVTGNGGTDPSRLGLETD